MTVIFAAPQQDEILVVQSLLASAGIESGVLSEHLLDVFPFFEGYGEGIRLAVADEEAEDAQALVRDYLARRSAQAGQA